jgi:nucleotide-binding universal stress UspA family protein
MMEKITVALTGVEADEAAVRYGLMLGQQIGKLITGRFFPVHTAFEEMERRLRSMERFDFFGFGSVLEQFREAADGHYIRLEETARDLFFRHAPSDLSPSIYRWESSERHWSFEALLLRYSILSDLLVLGRYRSEDEDESMTVMETLVCGTTGPVMVVPPNYNPRLLKDSRVVIGWKPNASCIRVITLALPLLRLAKQVTLLSIEDADEPSMPVTVNEYRELLQRHGVTTDVHCLRSAGQHLAEQFGETLRSLDADMALIGAFSSSRLPGFMRSGLTESMLLDCPVPLLCVH